MSLFTFAVSFYNAEKYIQKCIENLKKQTNPDFLCILVDDGSTDGSYEIALKESADDKRFSLIRHEKNSGLGAGRCTGIKNTKTEFITFIDADDEIIPETAGIIISDIKKQNADLYVYDYFQKSPDGNIEYITGKAESKDELFMSSDRRISHMWHKVYRTAILKEMDLTFYKTVSFAEDLYLCTKYFLAAKKTVFINKAYYYYIFNPASLVHSRSVKSIYENIAVLKNLLSDKELKTNPFIETYIKNDSFHAFGLLIFPDKRNPFQWKEPHFEEWRKINQENEIFIPEDVSFFVRFYLKNIKKKHDFTARILWNILKLKELVK